MKDVPRSLEGAPGKPEDARPNIDPARTGATHEAPTGEGPASPVGAGEAGLPASLTGAVVPFAVTILSFAGAILLVATLAGPSDTPSPETTTTALSATAARGGTAASPAPQAQAVRVVNASGSAQAVAGGGYTVTFTWILEGARDGDPAVVRFSIGNSVISEQRGLLSADTFDPSSGVLTLATSQECSREGWSAELVSFRDQPPRGERTARAPGVSCP
ncbi:MAG: hypothetical protein ACRDF0_01255 [Candidatus Limnocylindria bacterium]